MKLLKVGLVANAANGSTCETIISALANQDILEVCTPIVSGIQDSIDSVLANIEQEVQIPICKISRVEDALDGKINIIDCCNTESESIRYMVSSFLNNMVDLIIDLPSEICNSKDETALISLINETLSNEDGKPLNWTISGNVRTLLTTGDTLVDDIRKAHIALRKDATLIKPRFAVVAKDDTSHGNIASLREEKIMAFGPFEADTFINAKQYLTYDAVLFCDEDSACQRLLAEVDEGCSFEYISGLPLVVTRLNGKADLTQSMLKEVIYFSIHTHRNRVRYHGATKHPLERQWIPRGRDDFKLDLTKEESE